ncbi:hypothetical protein PR202_gb13241 [Eleusine coracana subsp. coracana]|uniref:Uncharacterized protein n=1 Tax=Eleusine coracana subsp. coracana TaxID=191504 RepID=A0AAV5ESR6_ELECO|nr:hypothetical protein PR202_gb13241 [Eleusine coracana subsp. coracana]
MGLMKAGPSGGEAIVAMAVGVPLSFTNGVDVDQVTRDVCFTSNSMMYIWTKHKMVTRIGDSMGRILKFDSKTNKVTVHRFDVAYHASPLMSTGLTLLSRSLIYANFSSSGSKVPSLGLTSSSRTYKGIQIMCDLLRMADIG